MYKIAKCYRSSSPVKAVTSFTRDTELLVQDICDWLVNCNIVKSALELKTLLC